MAVMGYCDGDELRADGVEGHGRAAARDSLPTPRGAKARGTAMVLLGWGSDCLAGSRVPASEHLPGHEHQRPGRDRRRPDGALWFTNCGNDSIGRITTAARSASTGTRISNPGGSRWARRRPLVHQHGNDSIGRITTTGTVTIYRDRGISSPPGIAAGPDGALWFTNPGNDSIGRITTAGTSPTYRHPSISYPKGITAGPDGALWFTNSGNNSIGRITTGGHGQQLHGHRHQQPGRDRGRAGRRAVVHQPRQRLDRADHDRRARSASTRTRASAPRRGSWPGRTARSGSPTAATTRSGGSRPRARSASTRDASISDPGDRARAGRRALVHQPAATTRSAACASLLPADTLPKGEYPRKLLESSDGERRRTTAALSPSRRPNRAARQLAATDGEPSGRLHTRQVTGSIPAGPTL